MTWKNYFIALLAVTAFQSSWAQETESAPQEPPFVQEENEFETLPEQHQSLEAVEGDDVLSIEDELQQAEPEKKSTVNLNEQLQESEKKQEDELIFEEPQATPIVEEPSVPEAPVVEVKPLPKSRPGKAVRRSAKGGVEYIEHPQAAKGLLTITKEGAYIYKTKEGEEHDKSGTFRVGMIDPPKITSADGTTTFDSMYSGSQQPMFMFDYEWQPFNHYGKLGVQFGGGIMLANGNGRFIEGDHVGEEAKEKYTFIAIPLNLGVVYRLEWMSRQWLAPYVSGGGTYIGVVEYRDDGKSPSVVGTPGVYGAGGMMFNISALDRDTAFTLSSEYGIANLWLTLEYRYLNTFSEDVDFTSGIAGAGITVDY
ncbi:hypothetical protein QJS83_09230 [Bdellovibrio sp. 22V]|uniref:hypothetical protein n=1 Tax=Bdellovibrio sp. 22V TaxID=3044166 RepID=UPI002542945B|nr:hypothetical protein [Bdellovibrio sp. 22V]WII70639.1 hypothetical protein QJS83_09230 [Bdellovibrio sp. 22V]